MKRLRPEFPVFPSFYWSTLDSLMCLMQHWLHKVLMSKCIVKPKCLTFRRIKNLSLNSLPSEVFFIIRQQIKKGTLHIRNQFTSP